MRYVLDFPPLETLGNDEDQWLDTTSNILYERLDGIWLKPFDQSRCGCGHPNAHPPCGYCENGEYHMSIWTREMEYDDYAPETSDAYNKESVWKTRALTAELTVQDLTRGFADKAYEEYKSKHLMDIREQIVEDIWDDVISEVKIEIYNEEGERIRTAITQDYIDEVRYEIKRELLKGMEEAKDRI